MLPEWDRCHRTPEFYLLAEKHRWFDFSIFYWTKEKISFKGIILEKAKLHWLWTATQFLQFCLFTPPKLIKSSRSRNTFLFPSFWLSKQFLNFRNNSVIMHFISYLLWSLGSFSVAELVCALIFFFLKLLKFFFLSPWWIYLDFPSLTMASFTCLWTSCWALRPQNASYFSTTWQSVVQFLWKYIKVAAIEVNAALIKAAFLSYPDKIHCSGAQRQNHKVFHWPNT